MAKKTELKERSTGEVLYPITTTECVIDKERSLSDTLKDIPKELFIKLWNTACYGSNNQKKGQYNEETGFFELNGLTDITFEQAIEIFVAGFGYSSSSIASLYAGNYKIRTNLPLRGNYNISLVFESTFFNTNNIEVVQLHYGAIRKDTFSSNPQLRRIGSINDVIFNMNFEQGIVLKLPKLEILYGVIRNNYSFSVEGCPLLTLANFKYWINNALNTAPITITVHPEIYAKLLGDGDYSNGDGTDEDWQQLVTDAVAKQITFATA